MVPPETQQPFEYTLDAYDYDLPDELIAQCPSEHRDASRLLQVPRTGDIRHGTFSDLADSIPPNAVLVVNDTRVVPARAYARKESGGQIELLRIPEPTKADPAEGRFLARGRLKRPGIKLHLGEDVLEFVRREPDTSVVLRSLSRPNIDSIFQDQASIPLPPYIRRPDGPTAEDNARYQTVYADEPGAVAAPTAGLHFTPDLMGRLINKGVDIVRLTLHVGPGTFLPVRTDDIREHRVLAEPCKISEDFAAQIREAKRAGRPIIAVGTTSVRALEGAALRAAPGTLLAEGTVDEDLVIIPGHTFRIVDGLITNFHLPRSSLLLLVSAFLGRQRLLDAYAEAVMHGYRFYSYGDSMFIPPEGCNP
ncbi:MAG: tRNA preQ1(34) S-adenosylmethionine ribosyltransferase-isomerase QueA [Myxococcales bacterium]|nr:tRNA preQ1(34) S-adenosylmethionine ribosyltransferase-isomerase QueA [Myxococcales bacterium]|tara:strand:- start:31 stop:1122 length:1092 start_codon:yes stop_codon:yes gene_type:complete